MGDGADSVANPATLIKAVRASEGSAARKNDEARMTATGLFRESYIVVARAIWRIQWLAEWSVQMTVHKQIIRAGAMSTNNLALWSRVLGFCRAGLVGPTHRQP